MTNRIRPHTNHNNDHIVGGTREDKQAKGARRGGREIRIEEQAYKGLGVIEPRMDGLIAQPA
jgi:hypothetical protein